MRSQDSVNMYECVYLNEYTYLNDMNEQQKWLWTSFCIHSRFMPYFDQNINVNHSRIEINDKFFSSASWV